MTNADLVAFAKRHPISISCALLAVVLGAGTFYRSSELPEVTARFEEKSAEGGRLSANVRNGNQLPEQLEQLTAAGAGIGARFVRGSELAQNLQYFYRLETDTGVKLLELRQNTSSAAAKSESAALRGVGFTVALQGEYFAVLDFIRRLESGAHFPRVMSASLSGSGPDRTGPVRLSLEIELLGHP